MSVASRRRDVMTGGTTTTVTQNYSRTTGAVAIFTSGDVIRTNAPLIEATSYMKTVGLIILLSLLIIRRVHRGKMKAD
jgi:hypothetical protein